MTEVHAGERPDTNQTPWEHLNGFANASLMGQQGPRRACRGRTAARQIHPHPATRTTSTVGGLRLLCGGSRIPGRIPQRFVEILRPSPTHPHRLRGTLCHVRRRRARPGRLRRRDGHQRPALRQPPLHRASLPPLALVLSITMVRDGRDWSVCSTITSTAISAQRSSTFDARPTVFGSRCATRPASPNFWKR